MKTSFLELLRCPKCRAERPFELAATDTDDREVRTGRLTCRQCGHVAVVEDGIAHLMHDPPDFVVREAAGLERFAEVMREDGWDRERIVKLPYEPSGYWFAQGANMEHMLTEESFEPGATILDIGSNTCWASNIFAKRGMNVVALDIADTQMQGLKTADWWFEESGVYFERMLSVMFDPALASESFDYVFCAEVLHHNHASNLRRTLAEIHRILKPGGKLVVINEPLKFPTNLKRDHADEVAEFEGHEHVYFLHNYLIAARRAGFKLRIVRPNTTPFFRNVPYVLNADAGPRESIARGLQQLLRGNPRGRQAYLAYKLLLGPDISLSFIGEKPSRN
jgi:SAM-dependent methyltransferase